MNEKDLPLLREVFLIPIGRQGRRPICAREGVSTSAEVDQRHTALDPRSLFEKSDAKTFKYQFF